MQSTPCESCLGPDWQAALNSPHGHICLCGKCAHEMLHNRESKKPAEERLWARLVFKVFGKAA